MIKQLLSIILIITEILFAANDLLLSNINDSAKVETLLNTVWEKRSNEPLDAIKLAKMAEALAEKLNDNSLLAKANNFLGIVYTNIGVKELALDYHFDALKWSELAEDKTQEAYSYNNIGGIYRLKNDFVLGSENILKAINLFEEIKDTTGLAYCYINMGRLYKDQSSFQKSLEYLNKSLGLAEKLRNEDLRSRILLEIANILFEKNKFKEAEKIYIQLVQLYEKINYLKGLAEVWNGLSELHYKNNEFYEALKFSNDALKLNRQILNSNGEITCLNTNALIYLSLNQIQKGKEFLSLALDKSNELNSPKDLINTFKTHYQFYKNSGNLGKALYYYEKYNAYKDSVITNEEIIKFSELESLIKAEKTEKEKQILQSNLEQQTIQRNYLIAFIVLTLITIVLVTFRFYEKKKLSEKLKKSNIVKDKFFSIIAHDLREPYNAIFSAVELLRSDYDALTEEEKKDSIELIGRLVKTDFDLLENLLLWAKDQGSFIELKPVPVNLCEILNNVTTLFQNNIKRKDLTVKINCDENYNVIADEQMLNSIFRNLISNSIKFSNKKGEIYIAITKEEEKVIINIEDNGTGMDHETIDNLFDLKNKKSVRGTEGESGSGLGLILTKEFVEKHNGTINVKSKVGEGSTFTITLPSK